MEPFFESASSRLYVGEGEDLLPRLEPGAFDAVICDPPYASGGCLPALRMTMSVEAKYEHSGVAVNRPTFSGDNRDQWSFYDWATQWLRMCRRLVKVGGYAMVFADWRQLPVMSSALQGAGWTWRGLIPWNKGRGSRAPHKGYFRHQCEYVLWGTHGPCFQSAEIGPLDGCFEFPVLRRDKHHLTGKPTLLLRELVKRVPVGGLILDNFAGSCTGGVASILEGRRFVGIEQSAAYADIGARRLEGAERGELLAAA